MDFNLWSVESNLFITCSPRGIGKGLLCVDTSMLMKYPIGPGWLSWKFVISNVIVLLKITEFNTSYLLASCHSLPVALKCMFEMNRINALTLSQCTLAGPVYTGMPLKCHWLTQCTLGYHWATHRRLGTLEHHWKNLVETAPHWNATGETKLNPPHTGMPLGKI